jgi:arsenate reductase (thioredoxin)
VTDFIQGCEEWASYRNGGFQVFRKLIPVCPLLDRNCSKSWDEFAAPNAPAMDFVFTVCDNAANEVCPYWPGQPLTAHWGIPDPASVRGTPEEIARAFRDVFVILDRRIGLFLSLPLATLGQLAIQNEITEIGRK